MGNARAARSPFGAALRRPAWLPGLRHSNVQEIRRDWASWTAGQRRTVSSTGRLLDALQPEAHIQKEVQHWLRVWVTWVFLNLGKTAELRGCRAKIHSETSSSRCGVAPDLEGIVSRARREVAVVRRSKRDGLMENWKKRQPEDTVALGQTRPVSGHVHEAYEGGGKIKWASGRGDPGRGDAVVKCQGALAARPRMRSG